MACRTTLCEYQNLQTACTVYRMQDMSKISFKLGQATVDRFGTAVVVIDDTYDDGNTWYLAPGTLYTAYVVWV